MHWLLSCDTALFHFINHTLVNPIFDWLMPVLSGNGIPWLGLCLLALPLFFYFGTARLRLCVLFMFLVVALGGALVIDPIKDSVSRPRPFVVLPDARLFGVIGKGYVPPLMNGELPTTANHHSMPSAHSANCFAFATVGFCFYRRRAAWLFFLAASIAFSRIYNGVHYPTDVLTGAVLGIGYSLAFLLAAQIAWNFFGKKFFPQWHNQLPNLLNPQPATCNLQPATLTSHWLHLGYLVIFLALIGRWIYLASGIVNLSGDEAYQWLWSKHLALSYYSKPPGIALIQWLETTVFGDTEFGVRFFSPVFAAVLSLLLLRFMTQVADAKSAFALLLMTFAAPLLVAGSILLTIDPPLVLCWMAAVIAGWRAVKSEGTTRDWLLVGLAMGLGFLCKYTAALQLVCWILIFWLQPATRLHLRKIGPWLALGMFALCTLPVLIWNAQHQWATIHHVAGDAGMNGKWHFTLNYFFEFVGAEAGLLNPIFFFATLWALWKTWSLRKEKPLWFFLWCMSAPLFLGYWLFSFHSRVLPNWIAAAVPPMFCLTVLFWRENKMRLKPWFTTAMLLGLTASVFMHNSRLIAKIAGAPLPGDVDFAHRSAGWRETAQLVETERNHFDPNAFIIADHYGTTGLYSFYSAPARTAANSKKPLVYCLDSDEPMNQFFFWDEYNYRQHRRGENALYVIRLDPYPLENGWLKKWWRNEKINFRETPAPRSVPPRVVAEFESVTNLGIHEIKIRDGRIFQRVQIFGCSNLK